MVLVDEPIDFTVTDEDIANGVPGSHQHCPAALALSRALGGARVSVRSKRAVFHGKAWRIPAPLREFVAAVDRGAKPLPPNRSFQLMERIY